jgi:hypothetical protein
MEPPLLPPKNPGAVIKKREIKSSKNNKGILYTELFPLKANRVINLLKISV